MITVQNPHPSEMALDTCIIKWTWRDWHQPRLLTISAVEDFIDDGTFVGEIKTDPAISASEYYKDFDPSDISVQTVPRPSRQCRGTGDPHYTTFDGYRWHIYFAGRYVLYKTTKRIFEVQAQGRGRLARHCAFAAREDNDVVVVWACNGAPVLRRTCGSTECEQGGFPKVSVRGSSSRPTYFVEFASGAMVRAVTRPYRMNLYLTAPGRDFNDVLGICGNFDGTRTNDGGRAYRVWDPKDLYDHQKPSYDLFAWRPSSTPPSPPSAPKFEECTYEPTFVRPILNRPDAEDITKFVRNLDFSNIISNPEIRIGGGTVDEDMDPIEEEDARPICEDAFHNSAAAEICPQSLPGFDIDAFIDDCIDDVTRTGRTDFLEDALEALARQCAERASRDLETWEKDEHDEPTEPNKDVQRNTCQNDCSGHGTCDKGICICDEGFQGDDCGINTNVPPVVESLMEDHCDSQGIFDCPEEVVVIGTGFWNSGSIKCRYGTEEVVGSFLGSTEVSCKLPHKIHRGAIEETVTVQVSLDDGASWTNNNDKFTWFDGVCQVCEDGGCKTNSDSCIIDDTCYRRSSAHPDNTCQHCDPSMSTDVWSWTYQHHEECGPVFASQSKTATIVGGGSRGEEVIRVDATNPNVAADPDYNLAYELDGGEGYFVIDDHGIVTLAKDLDIFSINEDKFDNLLSITARDQTGNHATMTVLVDFVEQSRGPLFNSEYDVTIPENTDKGTVILTVKAEDRLGDGLTYSWFMTEEGYGDYFAIGRDSGKVTVERELDFYDRAHFHLVVRARDANGQSHITSVDIRLEHVDMPPHGIHLKNSLENVPEDSSRGTVVGTLVTDHRDNTDGDMTFKYTTSSDSFDIQNDKLVTDREEFDYRGGETSFDVEVTSTDANGLSYTTSFNILISKVNRKPYNIRLNMHSEHEHDGTFTLVDTTPVDSIIATIEYDNDDDEQTVRCALSESGANHFGIAGNNLILINELSSGSPNYLISVVCVDDGTPAMKSDPATFTIQMESGAKGPENFEFDGGAVPENTDVGAVVGYVSAIDTGRDTGFFDFKVIAGRFEVSGDPDCSYQSDGGYLRCSVALVLKEALNYAENTEERITVSANSEDRVGSSRLFIQIVPVNKPIDGVQWDDGVNSIPENAEEGALVGTLRVIDPNHRPHGVGYFFELKDHTDIFELHMVAANRRDRRRRETEMQATAFAAEVRVRDSSKLDAGDSGSNILTITLAITDNAVDPLRTTVTTEVEVTDAPLHLETTPDLIEISEDTDVGSKVAELTLSGNDHQGVSYEMTLIHSSQETFRLDGTSLVLNAPLNYATSQMYQLVVEVETGETPAPTFTIHITVKNVPVLIVSPSMPEINTDRPAGQTFAQISLNGGSSAAFDFKLEVVDDTGHADLLSQAFGLRPTTLALVTAQSPSEIGLEPGEYTLRVYATNSKRTLYIDVPIVLYDDCRDNECTEHEVCKDYVNSYYCCVTDICVNSKDDGFSTRLDQPDDELPGEGGISKQKSGTDSRASPSVIGGAIAGAILLIALVIVAVILVGRRRENSRLDSIYAEGGSNLSYLSNPFYKDPEPVYAQADSSSTAFIPGMANPMYEWYKPDMSRQECSQSLMVAPVGSFIVRDSQATPGWFMMGVRTETSVVHEKIKREDDGMYRLLPASNVPQPSFQDIPSLTMYYTEPRKDIPFVLNFAMSNPMYAMGQGVTTTTLRRDEAAPAIPLKEKQRAVVQHVAAVDGEEIYTNTTDAQTVLNSSA